MSGSLFFKTLIIINFKLIIFINVITAFLEKKIMFSVSLKLRKNAVNSLRCFCTLFQHQTVIAYFKECSYLRVTDIFLNLSAMCSKVYFPDHKVTAHFLCLMVLLRNNSGQYLSLRYFAIIAQ